MQKKLAKIKYFPNNFQIIETGDHVICAISGKQIDINNLNYWNVELQEPYYSYKEAFQKRVCQKKIKIFISSDYVTKSIVLVYVVSLFQEPYSNHL